MLPNRLAFGVLAVACIAAAAGGGYIATRQNTVPIPAAASAPANAAVLTPPVEAPAAAPVREPDAVAGDTAAKRPSKTPPVVRSEAARQTRAVNAAVARQDPPSLNRTPPSVPSAQNGPAVTALATVPPPVPLAPDANAPPASPEDRIAQDPPPAPAEKTFEELVLSPDSVIGIQTENRVSSETARVEDRVEGRVTRDVKVSDKVAIPAGSRAIGTVTQVDQGGKFKNAARLCIKFTTIALSDGTRIPMNTEAICRSGEAPANGSAGKVGAAAIGGAILGAILGGGKGAAIGAAAGATGGTAAVAAGDRSVVALPAGSPLTVRVVSPVTITIEEK